MIVNQCLPYSGVNPCASHSTDLCSPKLQYGGGDHLILSKNILKKPGRAEMLFLNACLLPLAIACI